MLALGFITFRADTTVAQTGGGFRYEEHYASSRDLAALQNDLYVLDEVLASAPRRNRRSQEFQQRADVISRNVTELAEQMRQHNDGRHEARVGTEEVRSLRRDIATLRDDIENTQGQAQNQRRGRATNGGYVVPAGTEIQVMLDQDLSSRSSNPQDRITASTVQAIRMNGRTVIPAGASVSGYVREVRSKQRGQNDGWLKVDFDSLTPEGGRPVTIRSQVIAVQNTNSYSGSSDNDDRARKSGLGAILGGVIGAMIDGKKGALIGATVGAGGGLLASRGTDDVELPEGTLLTLRLDSAMNTARRDGMGNSVAQPASWQPATAQQEAEQVVARAYRAMLGREPDAASHVYVDKVLRERWTEADVSREIRKSPEYRNKPR